MSSEQGSQRRRDRRDESASLQLRTLCRSLRDFFEIAPLPLLSSEAGMYRQVGFVCSSV